VNALADNSPIVVFWSPEDEEWIADVPDLGMCSASGATPEEAVREALVGRMLWLEVAREDGIGLLEPRDSPYLPKIAREMMTDHARLAAAAASGSTTHAEGAAR
jgi:predicted RNase H-like HicB family nuclease